MSMDDQYDMMQRFKSHLEEFNQQLWGSWNETEQYHEAVSPIWQDSFRRDYDRAYDQLKEWIATYLVGEAPRYIEFFEIKLEALRRYLYGG